MTKNYSGDSKIDTVLSDAGLNFPAVNSWSQSTVVGGSVSLTYDWMNFSPANAPADGFAAFNAAQRAGAEKAMDQLSDIANVTFNYSSSGTADIEYGTVSFGGSSFSYTAGLASTQWTIVGNNTYYTEAKVYLTNSFSALRDMSEGGAGFSTMLHELAHAVGLDHTFENRLPPNGTDSNQYSLMSYTDHPEMNVDPSSYLLYDIAALQYLYGANMSTRTSDDTYSWTSNEAMIQSIWDAGGEDAIDASNQSRRALIDLNDGAFSSIGSDGDGGNATDNISIAFNARIENAFGGSGNDVLDGNEFDNLLNGNNGNDTLSGADGDDDLNGGDGNDKLYGGDDDDVVRGGDGEDRVEGDDGDDLLSGNSGDDLLLGGVGKDRIFGGSGDDTIAGGDGSDDLDGGSGNDRIFGNTGSDTLNGQDGLDNLSGGDGADVLLGRSGNDTIRGGNDNDRVFAGTDNDVVAGNNGDDILNGGSGNDKIFGGVGDDTIEGGTGLDRLSGGDGNDIFVFSDPDDSLHGSMRDIISDFTHNEDRIDLSGLMDGLVFVGTAAYSGDAGEVRYNEAIGRLYINLDGGNASELSIDVTGEPTLDLGDLIL